jgi:hypothetical protein
VPDCDCFVTRQVCPDFAAQESVDFYIEKEERLDTNGKESNS